MGRKSSIGKIGQGVKIAAGLFWADYGNLRDTVRELEEGGADWIHLEMRDGKYMDFAAPRGGIDIVEGIRPHTNLEIEVQLQMVRPSIELYRQLGEVGADLISLPIETTGEMLVQHLLFIKETLGLKGGVWAWQGTPIGAFEQYVPLVDIVEYECKAPFWKPTSGAQSPHTLDEIMFTNIRRLHDMLVEGGVESSVELMKILARACGHTRLAELRADDLPTPGVRGPGPPGGRRAARQPGQGGPPPPRSPPRCRAPPRAGGRARPRPPPRRAPPPPLGPPRRHPARGRAAPRRRPPPRRPAPPPQACSASVAAPSRRKRTAMRTATPLAT